jgi:hypothetical protein
MDRQKLVEGFNEWMRRFIETPDEFQREFEEVRAYAMALSEGKTPSYGHECVAYLETLGVQLP